MNSLAEKLVALINQEGASSFFALKNLLGIAATSLPKDGSLPSSQKELNAFKLIQEALFELRKPTRRNLTQDGVLWRGKIPFLDENLLTKIEHELDEFRKDAAPQKWGQYISPGGALVQKYFASQELRFFVEKYSGRLEGAGVPSCLYYDEIGAHIKPHVDTDNFCVNLNVMISHRSESSRNSKLVIYPVGDALPVEVYLSPGEGILMYADCIVHTRTPVSKGESIKNITVGFKPSSEIHEDIS